MDSSLPFRYEAPCGSDNCPYAAKWLYEEKLLCREHFSKGDSRKDKIKQGAIKLEIGPAQHAREKKIMQNAYDLAEKAKDLNKQTRGVSRGRLALRPCGWSACYPLQEGYLTVKLGRGQGRLRGRCFVESRDVRPHQLGITMTQRDGMKEWKIGTKITRKREGLYYSVEGEKEIVITQKEWQDLYYSHYEEEVRRSNEGLRLRGILYPGRMNLILSADRSTPALDEVNATSYLNDVYGTSSFRFEVGLYFILMHWYKPKLLPWNKQ